MASRQRSGFCWPPFCFREEKACVEWGRLLGSLTCLPRLLSHLPFGSWSLLDSNLVLHLRARSDHTANCLCSLQHLKFCFNTESRIRPHKCQLERPNRTAKHCRTSPSWLEYGGVFGCAGKERGLLFQMEMCLVCTLPEGLCGVVSISCSSCFGSTGLVHTLCFPPCCVSHSVPASWCMWTSSVCLTGQTSTVQILSRDFFHSCTPKRP